MNHPLSTFVFPANSPSYYYIRIGMDGCYTYVNEYFKKTFAHISNSFIGENFTNTVHPDDVELCNIAAECLHNTQKVVAITLRKPSSYGKYTHTHWNFFAEMVDDVLEIGCVGFDISDFVYQSGEHKNVVQKLDAVLSSSSESFYLLDKNKKLLSFNLGAKNAIKDFFSIDIKEGLDFTQLLIPNTVVEFNQSFEEALLGKRSFKEDKLTFPTGIDIWYRMIMSPAMNQNGEIFGVAISFINIDLLKRSELQLKEIAWQQSHKVRKPLSNILGLIALLKTDSEADKAKELLDLLEQSALELDNSIKSIVARTSL